MKISNLLLVLLSSFIALEVTTLTLSHNKANIQAVVPPTQILKYLNIARTQPKFFSTFVKKELDKFINDNTLPLIKGMNYRSNAGKKEWVEAISYLKSVKPIQPLKLNDGLSYAADDHAIDMVQNNFFEHAGSDGSNIMQRIVKRCGRVYGSAGENLGQQFKTTDRNHALQTVMSLIIDDGVPSRGHRKNIFNPKFNYVGIAAKDNGKKIYTVMEFHSSNVPVTNTTPNPKGIGYPLKVDDGTLRNGKKFPTKRGYRNQWQFKGGRWHLTQTITTHYSDGSTSSRIVRKVY